jgi:AcrR family transcriptional regulator
MSDREGYAAASIERIAKEAGTSKSTVLYYFKSKEAINRSVGQLLSENGAAYMTERIMAVDSSRERLQAHYLSSNLRFVARTPHTSTPSTASSRTSASTSARPMPCLRFDLDPDVPVRQPGRKRESTLAAAPSHRRGHPHSPSRPCSSSCPCRYGFIEQAACRALLLATAMIIFHQPSPRSRPEIQVAVIFPPSVVVSF